MDPYVQVEHKGKVYKTLTIEEGGKNPRWNETIAIPLFPRAAVLTQQ